MNNESSNPISNTLFDFSLGVAFGIGLAIAFSKAKENYGGAKAFFHAQAVQVSQVVNVDGTTLLIALGVVVAALMLYSIADFFLVKHLDRKQQYYSITGQLPASKILGEAKPKSAVIVDLRTKHEPITHR